MKHLKFHKIIIDILIIIQSLIILKTEDIFNNPLLIAEKGNPVAVRGVSGSYYIFTSGQQIILNSKGEIQSRYSFPSYNAPYIWIADESANNYYIFSSNAFYKVTLGGTSSSETKPSINYPDSSKFIGSISETKDLGDSTYGCLCPIETNEKIIYGRYNRFNIRFSFLKKRISYDLTLSTTSMEEKMACKKIESGQYICALLYGYIVRIFLFSHLSLSYSSCEMKKNLESDLNNAFRNHTSLELYDTNVRSKKLICAKNLTNFDIECLMFSITITKTKGSSSCTQTQSIEVGDIIIRFPTKSSSREDCFRNKFTSEYLFCCGGNGLIKCGRFYENNTLITTFDLEFPGTNSNLKFFSDQSTYANIIFLNVDSGNNKVYEYFIYLPTCKDINYTVIVHHSINEGKEENEKDNLNDLFTRNTNTKYYYEFETLPDDYGYIFINNEKIISGVNTKFLLEEDQSYIFDFISNTDTTVTNFIIPYQISIKESYSAKCSIYLTILPCYDSCSRCSKDKSESTSENHNCFEDMCKEGYYPSPLLLTNCFSEEEKEINWYLDNSAKRFFLCDNNCRSCYGPDSNNCLTCFNPDINPNLAYLYNDECLSECPEGTYEKLQIEGYYKCMSCYSNCKTCSERGEDDDMKCDTCNNNDIIYEKNCYKEYSNEEKTFYMPGSTSEITSCYQLHNYYIEENTYTCISSMPNTGYFLVNSNTGLFAKCHFDCKTCSQRSTDTSSNCDTCNNEELYLLEGNCIINCPEGYYSTVLNGINICKKCYKNCMTCNEGEIYNNLNQITNMNCLKCKKEADPNDSNNLVDNHILIESNCFPILLYTAEKITFDISYLSTGETEKSCHSYGQAIIYGEYKCISKPTNYYYVLNNEENTGIINICDISCTTCNEGKNILTGNPNCLTCSNGYFKTEDSNTNCILESLIPENYFKNPSDNIYYKCYPNCKKCNNFYNSENNNMNCIECKSNLYFVYETYNCYEMSFVNENSYYFSEEDNKFHECYFSCLKCSQSEFDEEHHNCDECKSGFYFEFNTKNCYSNSILERGYYLDDFALEDNE